MRSLVSAGCEAMMQTLCYACPGDIKRGPWLAQDIAPTNISINGNPCSIQLNITLSNVVPNTDTGRPLSAEGSKGNATVEGVEQADVTTVRQTWRGLSTKRLLHAAPIRMWPRLHM